jgi:hypothetical protein
MRALLLRLDYILLGEILPTLIEIAAEQASQRLPPS